VSLLTLSPESMRLRRIAKACSAGELSRLEYREARRRVINQFEAANFSGDEDTVPRFDIDVTQRRTAMMAEEVAVVGRQNWLVWMLLCTVLLAGLTLPVWTYAAVSAAQQIPPLSDRDPNPTSAPRIVVDAVKWTVPKELGDELAAEAGQFLTHRLEEIKQRNAPQSHGFSAEELEEVGRFLNAIGVHDRTGKLGAGDLEDLTALISAQKSKRGVSLIQLEQLAQELQSWVREQGYPLAQAYVPAQAVAAGEVRLDVQLGRLSNISVAGVEGSPLEHLMADLLGQPVQRDAVETKLNALNRTRGLRAEVSFVPGAEVGETEMVLHVKQQKRYTGSVKLDNYAVEDLGEERLQLTGQWNNPRGVGDVLSATAFTTLGPADHQYGEVEYAAPVLDGRYEAAVQIALADIQLDSGTELEGDGVLFGAQLTDTHLFTRTHRREVTYGLGVHDFDWDIVPAQRAWFASAGVDGHRLWDDAKIALSGSLQALVGGVDDERLGQDSSFWRVRAGLTGWKPFDMPFDMLGIDQRAKLVIDLQLQASADLLPPTLRLGATGPYANKGFSQAEALLDRGVSVNGALRFDAMLGQWKLGQWWVFMDSTYGEIEGLGKRWLHLTSMGLGWEAQLLQSEAGSLSSRITLGYPISHKGTGGFDDDGTQIYWSLQYAH
jgi:hemolysin activation/secretion protein